MSRRAVVSVAVALCLLVVTGAAAYWRTSVQGAQAVHMSWSPSCAGTTVRTDAFTRTVLARPGFHCSIAVEIRNDGDHDVRVTHLDGPLMGSQGGALMRGVSTRSAHLRNAGPRLLTDSEGDTYEDDNKTDAVWMIDLTVPPGATRSVSVGTAWREEGSACGGCSVNLSRWLVAELVVMHRTFHSRPARTITVLSPAGAGHQGSGSRP